MTSLLNNRMRRRLAAAILFLVAIALSIPARAQEKTVVSYDGSAGFNGPIWAAKDLRLFDSCGLMADLILVSGSARDGGVGFPTAFTLRSASRAERHAQCA